MLAAAPAAGLAILIVVFYLVEASLRKTPWVFTDELEWTQISRAIAATGHAARRGQPIFFKSLYVYLIAPAWWIHSTATAYAVIKGINAVVMCLAAAPAYLLARLVVPRRSAGAVAVLTVAIPAMSYASSVVPEALAYFWFTLASWLVVRALARPRPGAVALAFAVAGAGPLIEKEFVVLPAAGLLAVAFLWAAGGDFGLATRARRVLAALVGLLAFAYLFNTLVVEHVQRWTPSQYLNDHTFTAGVLAAGALAVGLGMLPVVGGAAALFLPERRDDARYRAFAAFLGAAALIVVVYTAAKVTYLAGSMPLVEERNVFFLSPLLLCGTAVAFEARRLDWRVLALASVLVMAAVWSNRLEVGVPYFEAPGLAILTLANRSFIWTVQDVHVLLACATGVGLVLLGLRKRPLVPLLAALVLGAWLLTGEIYATVGNTDEANLLATPAPGWVDAATHGAGVTFLGQNLVNPNTLWLTEFWNRSIRHVGSLDGSAPGPGPAFTPGLTSTDGTLGAYTGDPYTLAGSGVVLDAPVVATENGLTLYSTPHGWSLLEAESGIYSDGWASAKSTFAYFAPGGAGTLRVDLSRTAYTGPGPAGVARVLVGTVRLDSNSNPQLARIRAVRQVAIANGGEVTVTIPVRSTPTIVAVEMIKNLISLPSDPRHLGAQVAFSFARDRPAGHRR
jgi:hypothetical protein